MEEFKGTKAFLMIPVGIARDQDLLDNSKSILLMGEILSMLNVTGEFFMSNAELAKRLKTTPRTIKRYLILLENKGLIKRTNVYADKEKKVVVGRKITAGATLGTYMSLGWGQARHDGGDTGVTRVVTPTSPKYNKIKEQGNRTEEDINSSPAKKQDEPPIPYKEIINYLNFKTRKHLDYRTKSYQRLIRGRWNDNVRKDKTPEQKLADFKKVIDNKAFDWQGDAKMWNYMKPSTLFAPSHFDEYLNQNETRYVPPTNGGYGGEADLPLLPDDDDLPF